MDLKFILALFIWILGLWQTSEALKCGPNEEALNGQRCCSSCGPGFGVLSPCTPANDTQCEVCSPGEYYSHVYSHTDTCKPCRICSAYSHVVLHCNGTHDTTCECDDNYFLDTTLNPHRCRMCELCPEGYGVKKACTSRHNTVCWPCPRGTYSAARGETGCRVCSLCDEGREVQIQPCTARQNTVCVAIPKPTKLVEYRLLSTEPSIMASDSAHSGLELLPVYCSLLGLVIIGLLIYVAVKNVQNKKAAAAAKAQKNGGQYSSVAEGPLHGTPGGGHNDTFHQQQQGSDSGVYIEQDLRPVTSSTRIRELAPVRFKAIENLLMNSVPQQGGWLSLGREFGYNPGQLTTLESQAVSKAVSPAHSLLVEWSTNRTATVAVLLRCLQNIGRNDIVHMISQDMRYDTASLYQYSSRSPSNMV